ncbi:hypothetical protein SPRG_07156 [Saprolegnia parasitica CBS 223.65]|uniref:ABC transporter domain-containing protein n=1 Tax=Saprolegnia parasitica (strain CBS 223.65) TaxID=695850 RepID=A0A067CAU0_SAPPC|nr:hypothetical protein SPRG_07156 [Saprolegnia parasitica CBS 223.65]KDO27884.1 hypothetical protein SPRG_07156 [Saprolegnia parasitica CBS 223.65]|eukprot:XP_012201341.1 hypothetical protein SPRG_07156 [Saprolegnia parasitica CBS 223.65]
MPYFEALGYRCPPHRDVPDFLVDIGSPDLVGPSMSAQELATAFRSSSIHAAMLARMQQPSLPPLSPIAPFAEPFVASTMLIASRQLRVYLRNTELVQGRLGLVLIMGLLYATTFYDVDPSQVTTVLGVIFMAVLFLAVGQVPTLPIILDARAVFYKQRASQFHRTSSYVIAHAATQIPFALAETVVFGSILYWITGFAADATSFLTYLLVLFLTNLVFSTWFFVVGVVSPNMLVADPVALLCVLIFVVFAGFIISAKDIPDYLIWLYWIDPLAWSLRALTINQYTASDFKDCSFGGIDYCATTGSTSAGKALLEQYGLRTDRSWIWYGVWYLVGCYIAFLLLAYLILEYVRFDDTDHSHVVGASSIDGRSSTDDDDSAYLGVPKTPTVAISVAPREVVPVTLTFENLSYTVPNPTKGEPDLQLLKSISGYALPGTVTALMGASGAGKTTLMDVIAGRKTSGKIDGEIKLNGHIATDLAVRRSTGYCEQMDVHSESATFREALQFSSMLRQSDDIPAADKLAFAEECLSLLGLDTIGDKIIRGSSVEQMKRLTIGVELAASPSVLFLDEPTSGLDARSAKIVMAGIRKIASTGRTVVCTIHQPSAEVFEMFDSLLLLKRGGETVFFGDLGAKAVHLINYFASLPGTPPIAVSMNPAAWMLDVIGAGVEARSQALDFVKAFASSAERQALMDGLAVYAAPHPELEALTFGSKRAAAFNTQLSLLLQRFVHLHWRTPSYNNTRGLVSELQELALLASSLSPPAIGRRARSHSWSQYTVAITRG